MSNRSAPGVYLVERDFSDYAAPLGATVGAVVGTAPRGPLNVPTLITSMDRLLEVFGEPSPEHLAMYAARNFLRAGRVLWYNRVAKQYSPSSAGIVSLSPQDSQGRVFGFTATTGHGIAPGTYVKIEQTGKATTSNAKVESVVGNVITLATPLLDQYDPTAESDSSIEVSATQGAASSAEVFGVERRAGVVSRLVRFLAKDPGEYANFGTRKGIEVVIQDGGQFNNVNPSTQLPFESAGGVPLQGVLPSKPSVDVRSDLFKMTYANSGIRIGDTTGVNSDLPATLVLGVSESGSSSSSGAGGEVVLEVVSTVGFEAGQTISFDGSEDYDGTYEILEVISSTELLVSGFPVLDAESPENGQYWSIENQDATRMAVVYRCIDNDADASNGYSRWVAQGVLTKKVIVFYQGRQVEVFDNLIGYDVSSANYWDTVIGSLNTASSNSQYIFAEYLGEGQQPISTYDRVRFPFNPRLLMGLETSCRVAATSGADSTVLSNARGVNGNDPSASEYIGSVLESGDKTGLQAFRSKQAYEIDLLAVPGISTASVVQAILEVMEARGDCLGLVDPPFRLNLQSVVDWHNGSGPYAGYHAAFVSNKAALYYPWLKSYDPYTAQDVWLPPSAYQLEVFAYSDSVSEPHYAAAGYQRGKIGSAIQAERILEEGDVEFMYGPGNGNAINPIMTFSGDGIMTFGNRTLQRTASSLDRVNVRRMVFALERLLSRACRSLAFEQNDPVLWSQILGIINPAMDGFVGSRAIEDYRTVCDETVNTPNRRNQNEAVAKVYAIPTKSGEKIELNISLLRSGASIDATVAQDTSL